MHDSSRLVRRNVAYALSLASQVVGFALAFVCSPAAAQERPPAQRAPATPPVVAPQSREAVGALELAHIAARSPTQLLRLALSYAALAESSKDPWDAVLALIYFERGRALDPLLATPEVVARMAFMRQLAGQRTYQPPLPGARFPVQFSAYDSDDVYTVEAGKRRCTTPCTLDLVAGSHSLHAAGDGEIKTEIVVPTEPSRVRLEAHSNWDVVAGSVLIPTGIAIGGLMWMVGLECKGGCTFTNVVVWPVVGASMLVTGIVFLAAAEDPPCDANRVERVGLAPWLTTGPAGAPEVTGVLGAATFTF